MTPTSANNAPRMPWTTFHALVSAQLIAMNSLTAAAMQRTATAMPTAVTDLMSNRKTTIENRIQQLPVTRKSHHGNWDARAAAADGAGSAMGWAVVMAAR